jgi:hypothetical protein
LDLPRYRFGIKFLFLIWIEEYIFETLTHC